MLCRDYRVTTAKPLLLTLTWSRTVAAMTHAAGNRRSLRKTVAPKVKPIRSLFAAMHRRVLREASASWLVSVCIGATGIRSRVDRIVAVAMSTSLVRHDLVYSTSHCREGRFPCIG